jgi:Mn-containing catalase
MKDLLSAEQQLIKALPEMASAARNPKLQEAFQKHLKQTEQHFERLQTACEMLDGAPEPGRCRAMEGLIEEGKEKISEVEEKDDATADLSLIAAAQKIEHYEIAAYGTMRTLALQLGEPEVAKLLSQTLGEEEGADYLLTSIAKPILQEATLSPAGAAGGGGGKTTRATGKSPRVRHA